MIEDVELENCPACGHAMTVHHGRHCTSCEASGETCPALEPGVESPGG
jgi:hypothetical protein